MSQESILGNVLARLQPARFGLLTNQFANAKRDDIMDIKQLCCSLELATQLKKLGVKQDSFLHYFDSEMNGSFSIDNINFLNTDKKGRKTFNDGLKHGFVFSAFTTSELFEIIGKKLVGIYQKGGQWMAQTYGHTFYAENLVDALAKLVICILENKKK